ncbi:hypothetical protein BDD12DRAFT_892419 [Trichophaea hybrida]|nr:hypothetical protein BDD12DRAFT_892419 [Trichophaea hybrida]
MSTETHRVMDPLKLDAKLATPTKEIGYASIGSALYTRGGNIDHTKEETDDIRNTGAPTANWTAIQEEMMNEHVTNTDSLVISKLIAFTTNEFKSGY